jgi:GDSL-like Lipase/Acylhydrolase family
MRLVLVIVSVVFAILLAEAASRVADRFTCRDNAGEFWEPDRWLGWAHTPGAHGWAKRCLRGKPEWQVYTRINSHGLRDRDVPYERQGKFRILALGDSFTEGLQVEQEETFERGLEQRFGDGVEVLNAGVSGYGTDNELLFFMREGWKYQADLVLLVFNTSNDILENHYGLMRGTHFPYPDKPHFVLEDGRLVPRDLPLREKPALSRAVSAVQRSLARHSALYRLLPAIHVGMPGAAQAAPPMPFPGGTLPPEVYLVDYPEPWSEAWRITRGLVLRLRQAVEARGSRFAVVVINAKEEVAERRWRWTLFANPAMKAFEWDVDKPNRLITSFLARRGIATIPLLEVFRTHFRETNTSGFYEWDVHWAPSGHALAADAIARGLVALSLVPAGR